MGSTHCGSAIWRGPIAVFDGNPARAHPLVRTIWSLQPSWSTIRAAKPANC